jgi:mannose-6-phosphate isomerase-like protein (cupin superfamily)
MGVAAERLKDIGPDPQSFDIEHATKDNTDYRSVAWSGRYLQVTLMSIPPGQDIGLEAHPGTDQFLRLDAGSGRVQMGPTKDDLPFDRSVSDGWCVLVPAGTWHNITNTGPQPMQLYAVYAPAHHTPGKVQATSAQAEADTDDRPADWSVQTGTVSDKHG